MHHRDELDDILGALDASGIGVWSWQAGDDAVRWNRQMFVLFGRATDAAPASYAAYLSLILEADRGAVDEAVRDAMARAAELQEPGSYRVEHRVRLADDTLRWLECRGSAEVDAQARPRHLSGTTIDITERKRLEEQLIDARKQEALARFSGHVAHDFNNLLTVILGSVDLIPRDGLPEPDRLALQAIATAAESASELTRGMLLFARRNVGAPRVLDIGTLVNRVAPMLRQATGQRHTLVLKHQGPPCSVRIDAGQAQLMLLNLVVNAVHAMKQPGTVSIITATEHLAESDRVRPEGLPPGTYGAIHVRDEGEGIPAETLPHIFEPFFTTRDAGKGTGLGLAACQGIVAQASGAIRVRTLLGEGSVFTVLLPSQGADAIAEDALEDTSVPAPGGSESVLVVDDQPMLRLVFTRALTARGYQVTSCDSAEAALIALERERFALVLADVAMPGMGGIALAGSVKARWPDMRVMLTSGELGVGCAPYAFVAKPVTPDELARRVREELDRIAAR